MYDVVVFGCLATSISDGNRAIVSRIHMGLDVAHRSVFS